MFNLILSEFSLFFGNFSLKLNPNNNSLNCLIL